MEIRALNSSKLHSLLPSEEDIPYIGEQVYKYMTRFLNDSNIERYIQVLCSVSDLDDEYLLPAYMKYISKQPFRLLTIIGKELPIDFYDKLQPIIDQAGSNLTFPSSALRDNILFVIGRYAEDTSEALKIDSLWEAVFRSKSTGSR